MKEDYTWSNELFIFTKLLEVQFYGNSQRTLDS